MIRNTFTTSIRFILRSKIFTAINLIGLTAGLTASFFLLVYIINEFSFNTSFRNSQRIFRLVADTENGDTPLIPSRLADSIARSNPGITGYGCLTSPGYFLGTALVRANGHEQQEPGIFCADPEIITILGVGILAGSPWTSLPDGSGIILSESTAERYFGKENPVGQELRAEIGGFSTLLKVTGVFEDFPWNSTIRIDFLTDRSLFLHAMMANDVDPEEEANHYSDDYQEAWYLLKSPDDKASVEASFSGLLEAAGSGRKNVRLYLQPVRDIHLHSQNFINDIHLKGNRRALFYYMSLAIFVLLLAGINYSILSTARSALRFKEVGVRKVLGASNAALRNQLLLESMLLTFLSLPLSFLALGLIEPFVGKLYGYEIRLYTWNMLVYIPVFTAITLLIGFLSGAYLAGYLASLNPLKAIRNQITRYKRVSFSRAFTVFQLFITMTLLICLIVIVAQLHFCTSVQTGIRQHDLLIVPIQPESAGRYPALREAIQSEPSVVSVSGSSIIPPTEARNYIDLYGSDTTQEPNQMELYYADAGFLTTLGVLFTEGMDFVPPFDSLSGTPMILNQQAAGLLQLDHPVGSRLMQFRIYGVVRDFSIHSFYEDVHPALFVYQPEASNYLIIRHKPGSEKEAYRAIVMHWQQMIPEVPFICYSYTEELSRMYRKEIRFGWVVASFTLMAFLITGMGLFGLALLISERRMKETAIRKVFGASNSDILFRMLKEFLLYAVIATLFAIPAAWIVMDRWLSTFARHTPMHWYLFALAILTTIFFVAGIIVARTCRVLRQQPINALRYE